MRSGGTTAVSATSSEIFEHENIKKALHAPQPATTDKENLAGGGRVLRSSGIVPVKGAITNEMSEKTKVKTTEKDRKVKNRIIYQDTSCQTHCPNETKIKEDLIRNNGQSENYWQFFAEKKRIALQDALEKNRDLQERKAKLEEENRTYKEMLDETRALVEVLQEMIEEDSNNINSLDDSNL